MGFVMALFDDKIPPLEQLLSEPSILRLLQLLEQDVICLTAGQVHRVLRAAPSEGRHRHFHEHIRDILHGLEEGGYLKSARVKCLPPATVGNAPLFRLEKYDPNRLKSGCVPPTPEVLGGITIVDEPDYHLCESLAAFTFGDEPVYPFSKSGDGLVRTPVAELPVADISHYVSLAKRRLPSIKTHRETRLYFTTPKAANLVCGRGRYAGPWFQSASGKLDYGNRAEVLIEAHRVVENIPESSPQDIACTQLTALYNLNQFMLGGCFQPKIAAGEWSYKSLAMLEITKGGFEISVKDRGKVSLFFLRPLLPDELKALIGTWGSSSFDECWWI
jgi:hypothetical protein